MYDIIIIGGGPAGATLARLIGKDYKVLVLERRDFQESYEYNRVKPCGGLIAPDAQLMLAKFGLGVPKSVLMSPQLFAVRVLDFDNSNERYYQRNYIIVSLSFEWLKIKIKWHVLIIKRKNIHEDKFCPMYALVVNRNIIIINTTRLGQSILTT